jgi:hypothetical protein
MLLHPAVDEEWNTACAANARNVVMTEGVNNLMFVDKMNDYIN